VEPLTVLLISRIRKEARWNDRTLDPFAALFSS
jgi:hypothetical protein